ncbi:MAG TPA: outer membrane protein [Xanthobacteraceae bacterium]|nr:outer membrane protein [Xanthobacteraceae bacterium]
MLRNLLSGCALAALAAAPALGADMSYRAPAPIMAAPMFTWSGFYLGASVGYGWSSVDGLDGYYAYSNGFYDVFQSSGDLEPSGWFGGMQAGYNYQFYNNIVLGIEADVFFADMKDDMSVAGWSDYAGAADDDYFYRTGNVSAKIESFGTIRARLGYAYDRFLPYVTGGLAWADVKISGSGTVTDYNLNSPDITTVWYSSSTNETVWGWTIGLGVEYALTDNWTVKAEYLYADLGATNFDALFEGRDLDYSLQTVKMGVNYKF